MITFIAQHQFWTAVAGYWILSAAVSLLPEAAPWRACASRPDPAANALDASLGYKEFEETIETLLGHFLLYVVSGGKRLDGLQIAGEFPPDCWIFVRRRCASCTPQNEERSRDLFIFVGRVHLEIDSRARAIIAASAADCLRREAAYEFVHHDFGSLPRDAAAVSEKPLRRYGIDHSLGERLRLG